MEFGQSSSLFRWWLHFPDAHLHATDLHATLRLATVQPGGNSHPISPDSTCRDETEFSQQSSFFRMGHYQLICIPRGLGCVRWGPELPLSNQIRVGIGWHSIRNQSAERNFFNKVHFSEFSFFRCVSQMGRVNGSHRPHRRRLICMRPISSDTKLSAPIPIPVRFVSIPHQPIDWNFFNKVHFSESAFSISAAASERITDSGRPQPVGNNSNATYSRWS